MDKLVTTKSCGIRIPAEQAVKIIAGWLRDNGHEVPTDALGRVVGSATAGQDRDSMDMEDADWFDVSWTEEVGPGAVEHCGECGA